MLRCIRPNFRPVFALPFITLAASDSFYSFFFVACAAQKRINKKKPKNSIFDAARDGDVELIQDYMLLAEPGLFSEKDKDNNKSAVYYAVRHGHLDVVRLCLSAGAKMEREWGFQR